MKFLFDWGLIDKNQLKKAEDISNQTHRRLSDIIIEMGLADEDQVTKALAQQFDMEYIDLDHHSVDKSAIELIPESIIRQNLVLPLGPGRNPS